MTPEELLRAAVQKAVADTDDDLVRSWLLLLADTPAGPVTVPDLKVPSLAA